MLPFAEAREGVAEAVRLLRVLEARFARDTVNIGVSGQARVGKSHAAAVGLRAGRRPDPDRARRCRSPPSAAGSSTRRTCGAGHAAAALVRHLRRGRRRAVPRRAGHAGPAGDARTSSAAGPTPAAAAAGPTQRRSRRGARRRRATSPGPPELGHDAQAAARHAGLVPHLRARPHRRRAGRCALDELRPLGRLPDERRGAGTARSRGATSRCATCASTARSRTRRSRQLAVVDLPGLGEVAARAEAHHVGGLQNEVDVVLLVKRPVEGMAYWGDADARALDLLDFARGFVAQRDFVFLRAQHRRHPTRWCARCATTSAGRSTAATPDRFFRVLEADAADTGDVFARVLVARCSPTSPSGCPAMDADVLAGTRARAAGDGRTGSRCWPTTSAGCWRRWRSRQAASPRTCDLRARRLRQDLSAALVGLVDRAARAGARRRGGPGRTSTPSSRPTPRTRDWITGGLGVGEQAVARRGAAPDDASTASAPATPATSSTGSGWRSAAASRRSTSSSPTGCERCGSASPRSSRPTPATLLADGAAGEEALRRFAELLAEASEPLPAAAPGGRAAARPSGWTTAPSCTPGCAPSWTGSRCRSATRSPASSATGSSSRSRRTAPSSCTAFVVQMAEQAAYLTKKAAAARGRHPGAGAARGRRAVRGHDDPLRGLRAGVPAAGPLVQGRDLARCVRRDRRGERPVRRGSRARDALVASLAEEIA